VPVRLPSARRVTEARVIESYWNEMRYLKRGYVGREILEEASRASSSDFHEEI